MSFQSRQIPNIFWSYSVCIPIFAHIKLLRTSKMLFCSYISLRVFSSWLAYSIFSVLIRLSVCVQKFALKFETCWELNVVSSVRLCLLHKAGWYNYLPWIPNQQKKKKKHTIIMLHVKHTTCGRGFNCIVSEIKEKSNLNDWILIFIFNVIFSDIQ